MKLESAISDSSLGVQYHSCSCSNNLPVLWFVYSSSQNNSSHADFIQSLVDRSGGDANMGNNNHCLWCC